MEYIGKQISIKRNDNGVSIVIVALAGKLKNNLLFACLFLWSVSGIIIMTQFFVTADQNTKAALMVWLAFWAYFEYVLFKAYMWRKYGVEKIKLRENKLLYKRDVAGKGKIKTYEIDFVKDLRILVPKGNSFADNMSNSYWSVGGERLAFDYYGKEIKFGFQLEQADAEALYKVLKKEFKV